MRFSRRSCGSNSVPSTIGTINGARRRRAIAKLLADLPGVVVPFEAGGEPVSCITYMWSDRRSMSALRTGLKSLGSQTGLQYPLPMCPDITRDQQECVPPTRLKGNLPLAAAR